MSDLGFDILADAVKTAFKVGCAIIVILLVVIGVLIYVLVK